MEKTNKQLSVVMGPVHLVMVVALVIGAYFLGTLKTKVDLLASGAGQAAQPSAAGQPVAQPEPAKAGPVPEITKSDWVKGDRNAPVALIEYSDLECPFCKQFHKTAQRVVDEYAGKVKWVYRHYPLSFHANAQKEAEAAECVGELGGNDAFWKYIDAIYERTTATGTGFALDALAPLAKEQGLNEAKFTECLNSGKMAQRVKDQMDGGTAAGVSGTPGNIIMHVKSKETRLVPGAVPFEQLKPVIDEMLKK